MLPSPVTVVGGVGELWQGDLDLGRHAAQELVAEGAPSGVAIEDFSFGAVEAARRIGELRPDTLVLIAAVERGRQPGSVEVRPGGGSDLGAEELHAALREDTSGQTTVDLVLNLARGLGTLPRNTLVVEIEPASTVPSRELSKAARHGLIDALEVVRAALGRPPWAAPTTAPPGTRSIFDRSLKPSDLRGLWSEMLGRTLPPDGAATVSWDQLRARMRTPWESVNKLVGVDGLPASPDPTER